ncbi:sarcosine oxidase subunit gamma family protein, partial [Klebsiella pneumoniae]
PGVHAESPLHHAELHKLAGKTAAKAGIVLREKKLLGHLVLRGDAADPAFAAAVHQALGLELPVALTLVASGEIDTDLLQRCRALPCAGRGNLSQLPGGLLVARCLADEALHARAWLIELWRLLRPALLGREAV